MLLNSIEETATFFAKQRGKRLLVRVWLLKRGLTCICQRLDAECQEVVRDRMTSGCWLMNGTWGVKSDGP